MSVPKSFFQGDTVEWEDSIAADYPASSWTLTYTFINIAGKIEIVAQANGDDYIVNLPASLTATYIPGDYTWVGKVADTATGTKVYTVLAGSTTIYRDIDELNSYDTRPWYEIALENVEAVIANRATMDQESYSIQGRSLARTPLADLINLRKYLQNEVSKDEDLLNDGPSNKRAQVRF